MSIQSGMKAFELQKWSKAYDSYGNPIDTWTKVADIEVSISIEHHAVVNNDVAYKVGTPAGMTMYKGFSDAEKYRLKGTRNYEVTSFAELNRWTSLLLKEVI